MQPSEFEVKDSGVRQEYASGMRRDTQEGKPNFLLAVDGPMFARYAEHMTKGAAKYGARNWQLADSAEELERFKASALRHMMQWLDGNVDEDHAAAVWFNINAAEHVKERLDVAVDDKAPSTVAWPPTWWPTANDYKAYMRMRDPERDRFHEWLDMQPLGEDLEFYSQTEGPFRCRRIA